MLCLSIHNQVEAMDANLHNNRYRDGAFEKGVEQDLSSDRDSRTRLRTSLSSDESAGVSSMESRGGSWCENGESYLLPSASELLVGGDEQGSATVFQNYADSLHMRSDSGGEASINSMSMGHVSPTYERVPEDCLFVSGLEISSVRDVQRMSSGDGTGTGYRSPPSRSSSEAHRMRREPSVASTISQPSTSLLVDRLLLKSQRLQEHIVNQMNLDHHRGSPNASRNELRPGEFSPSPDRHDTICASSTCSLQENHHARSCSLGEEDHSAMEWMGEKLEDALLQIKALHTENERLMSTLSDRETQISQLEDQLRKYGLGDQVLHSAPPAPPMRHGTPPLRRFRVAWSGSAGVDYRGSPNLADKLNPNVDFAPSGSILEVAHVEGDWVETRDGKWLPMWLPNFGPLLEEIEDFCPGPGSSTQSNGSGTSPVLKCRGGTTEDMNTGPSEMSMRSDAYGRGLSVKSSSHPSPAMSSRPQPPQEVRRQYSESVPYREPHSGSVIQPVGSRLSPPVRASTKPSSSIPRSHSTGKERITERMSSAPARTRTEMEQQLRHAMGVLQMYRQQHAILTDSVNRQYSARAPYPQAASSINSSSSLTSQSSPYMNASPQVKFRRSGPWVGQSGIASPLAPATTTLPYTGPVVQGVGAVGASDKRISTRSPPLSPCLSVRSSPMRARQWSPPVSTHSSPIRNRTSTTSNPSPIRTRDYSPPPIQHRRFRVVWQRSAGVDFRSSPSAADKIAPNRDFAPSGTIVEALAVEGDWICTPDRKWLPLYLPTFGRLLEEEAVPAQVITGRDQQYQRLSSPMSNREDWIPASARAAPRPWH